MLDFLLAFCHRICFSHLFTPWFTPRTQTQISTKRICKMDIHHLPKNLEKILLIWTNFCDFRDTLADLCLSMWNHVFQRGTDVFASPRWRHVFRSKNARFIALWSAECSVAKWVWLIMQCSHCTKHFIHSWHFITTINVVTSVHVDGHIKKWNLKIRRFNRWGSLLCYYFPKICFLVELGKWKGSHMWF